MTSKYNFVKAPERTATEADQSSRPGPAPRTLDPLAQRFIAICVERAVAEVAGQVGMVRSLVGELEEKVLQVGMRINAIETDLRSAQTQVNTLSDKHDSSVSELTERISALLQDHNELADGCTSGFNRLQAEIANNTIRLNTLENDLLRGTGTVADRGRSSSVRPRTSEPVERSRVSELRERFEPTQDML